MRIEEKHTYTRFAEIGDLVELKDGSNTFISSVYDKFSYDRVFLDNLKYAYIKENCNRHWLMNSLPSGSILLDWSTDKKCWEETNA